MTHNSSLQTLRSQAWPAAQKFFDTLPTDLFHQSMLLRHNLALKFSESGQFKDILCRPQDYPLLDQHLWLFNDWGAPHAPGASHILCAALFQFMAFQTERYIADGYEFFDDSYQELADVLFQQARFHWEQAAPNDSPFWESHQSALELPSNQWAIATLSLIASARALDHQPELPRLLEMSAHLQGVFQTVEQLSNLRRDCRDGRISPPIQRALQAVHATDPAKITSEFVLGALAFTGTGAKLLDECQQQADSARALAAELNLPSFLAFCAKVDTLIQQVRGIFSLRTQPVPGQDRLRAFFTPAHDILSDVIAKAEGYLLADPTYYESWEVQRITFADFPLLTGQVFPTALIVEVLAKYGHDVAAQVETIFEICRQSGFRYYNGNTTHLVPDADTLAFALRMLPYSPRRDFHAELLQAPLRWMRQNQRADGQISVWFRNNDWPGGELSPLAVLYGNDCATVETNLLTGLLGYDRETYRDIIETCAESLTNRWLTVGLGATEHYTPLFSLWAGLELFARLADFPAPAGLRQKLAQVSDLFIERLAREAQRPNLSPQDAAFLTLSSFCANDPRLPYDSRWRTILFKNQNFDGCWPGEPIYVTPSGRGLSTTWHKSRSITTAFCYHALRQIQARS
jgi:hypothetical protein